MLIKVTLVREIEHKAQWSEKRGVGKCGGGGKCRVWEVAHI
jgi:hypothetical protein